MLSIKELPIAFSKYVAKVAAKSISEDISGERGDNGDRYQKFDPKISLRREKARGEEKTVARKEKTEKESCFSEQYEKKAAVAGHANESCRIKRHKRMDHARSIPRNASW
jgi:hypothetical protein